MCIRDRKYCMNIRMCGDANFQIFLPHLANSFHGFAKNFSNERNIFVDIDQKFNSGEQHQPNATSMLVHDHVVGNKGAALDTVTEIKKESIILEIKDYELYCLNIGGGKEKLFKIDLWNEILK